MDSEFSFDELDSVQGGCHEKFSNCCGGELELFGPGPFGGIGVIPGFPPGGHGILGIPGTNGGLLTVGGVPNGYLPNGYVPNGFVPNGFLPNGTVGVPNVVVAPNGGLITVGLPNPALPNGGLPNGTAFTPGMGNLSASQSDWNAALQGLVAGSGANPGGTTILNTGVVSPGTAVTPTTLPNGGTVTVIPGMPGQTGGIVTVVPAYQGGMTGYGTNPIF